MADTVGNVLRFIFFVLDTVVYWLIDQVYWLFTMLSQATLFTSDQINSFSSRIYVLVTIIMMFKLGFSFINYIVNPDMINDKQKGGGKLVQNIVITIALLASVPTIFNEAYYLQNIIFNNKVIDKILLGDTTSTGADVDKTKMLSVYTFLSFYRPTTKVAECQAYQGIEISAECATAIDGLDLSGKASGTMYRKALLEGNLSLILNSESINNTGIFASTSNGTFYQTEKHYLFDYYYFVSTIVGAFLAWILLGFCLDLAVRSVKLGFLQIIAPIPILLSLAPQQKNNTLNNWGKECISTWASLFVRIGVVSFALNLILLINNGGGVFSFVTGGQNNYAIVTVFITIGILLFAKEFPKLIEDLLGVKNAGKLTFNPFKKLGETPLIGGAATAGLTLAGAGALAGGRALFGAGKALASVRKGKGSFKDQFADSYQNDTMNHMKARLGAGWSSAKEKFSSAGMAGTNKLGGSMHKSYAETFKDSSKEDESYKLGDKLYKKTNGDDKKKYELFSDPKLSGAMRDMDNAKTRRDQVASNYEQAKMEFDSTKSVTIDGQPYSGKDAIAKVDEMRVNSLKASSDYDKLKADFDVVLKRTSKSEAEKYKAYSAADDRNKARSRVSAYTANRDSASAASAQPAAPTQSAASAEAPHPTGVLNSDGNQLYSDGSSRAPGQGGFNAASGNSPGESLRNQSSSESTPTGPRIILPGQDNGKK